MPRKNKKIPQTINRKEFQKIIQTILNKNTHCLKTNFIKKRNALMITLQYFLGLRPKEARAIKIYDIDFEGEFLYIPPENNKQRNPDKFPIPSFLCIMIEKYILEKNKIYKKNPWLFPSTRRKDCCIERGTHMRFFRDTLRKANLLRPVYKDAKNNIRANLTLYSLRHSFGTRAMEILKDLRKVANLLRQYDFFCRSTLIYVHTANNNSRKEMLGLIYQSGKESQF